MYLEGHLLGSAKTKPGLKFTTGTRLMNCYAKRSIRPAYPSYVKSHFKMHPKHGFFWHSLGTVWCDEVNLELGTLQTRLIELYVHTYFVKKAIVTEDMTSNFMALFVGIGSSRWLLRIHSTVLFKIG